MHKRLEDMTMAEMFISVADPTSPHYIQPTPDRDEEIEEIDHYDATLDLMADFSEAQLVKMHTYARGLLCRT